MVSEWLPTLLRVYAQTAAASVLFVLAGHTLLFAAGRGELAGRKHAALICGRAYFAGLSCWLALFVGLSRLLSGARVGAGLALSVMLGIVVVGRVKSRTCWPGAGSVGKSVATFALLVLIFFVINIVCWMDWHRDGLPIVPSAWDAIGTIHAGRYANYALFIAANDFIPFLAQDMGQSMLGALHLMLGVRAPLAALLPWLSFSLAALTLTVFGELRTRGLSRSWAVIGTFFTMSCNIALSCRQILVFDNGSPLAFIGYPDAVAAIGTFLVFVSWLEQLPRNSLTPATLTVPGLLALTWCWYAPQNLLLAVPTAGAALWSGASPNRGALPHQIGLLAVVVTLAIGLGMTQLGPLLPRSWRQDTGMPTVLPASGVAFRPYIQYVISNWSDPRWNDVGPPDDGQWIDYPLVYERLRRTTKAGGAGAFARAALEVAASELVDGARVYFFPLMGLVVLLFVAFTVPSDAGLRSPQWRAAVALAAFGTGFGVFFLLEWGGMKWWLSRFLMPGTTLCLLWGYEAAARVLERVGVLHRTFAAAILVVAVYGPLSELAWVARENLIRTAQTDPIGRRLTLLAHSPGPFVEYPNVRRVPRTRKRGVPRRWGS